MTVYWKQNKGILFCTLCMGLIASALATGVSVILQQIIDVALSKDTAAFFHILIFTAIYMVILCTANYFSSLFTKHLTHKIIKAYRQNIFQGILRHVPCDFYKQHTADYISALTNDLKLVEEHYIATLFSTLEHMVIFLFTLFLLLFLSPLVTVVLLFTMALMFLIPAVMGKLLEKHQEAVSKQSAAFTDSIKDIFSGFETIHSYHLYPFITRKFQSDNRKESSVRFKTAKLFALNEGLSDTLAVLSTIAVIFISAYLVLRNQITMGTLLALVQLSGTFITPVVLLMQNIPKIQSVKPVIARLNSLADYRTEHLTGTEATALQDCIRMKHVSFSYTEQQPVLKDLSLTLQSGRKYAILGHSGCGKSTLARLLTGYTAAYEGNIYYDHTELRAADIASLSDFMAVIHQNAYLFHDTVKNNITLYKTYTENQFSEAIKDSGIQSFQRALPLGYNSPAGENGSLLSGGQKQRIALARALIRSPEFLILDEGTSAIDMQTAIDIENKLLEQKSLTLLTITHSLNEDLLRKYDEIIYMDKGAIVAQGPFGRLLEECAPFRNFIN